MTYLRASMAEAERGGGGDWVDSDERLMAANGRTAAKGLLLPLPLQPPKVLFLPLSPFLKCVVLCSAVLLLCFRFRLDFFFLPHNQNGVVLLFFKKKEA